MNSNGYQVIARRWRPKQFLELVGQDHIVRTLTNAIEKNRIAHAYLFVGPRGTGKTSTARLFAKSLNCTNGPSITPPEDCLICKAIMDGSCLDVIEIDGASNNSVEQVRALRDDCQYTPSQARFKIYIIDEVHMLSNAAFNALLKTLEEPPAHVKFIFATTESHKVLPTIVSRCQRFEFRPIADSIIAEKLRIISKAEGLDVEDAVFLLIARLAAGGMRDAQSILDQLISFCGTKITEQDIVNVYGLASFSEIKALTEAMVGANYPEIIRIVTKFDEEGRDFYRILQELQIVVHEALLDSIKNKNGSNVLGNSTTTESLMRMLEVLHQGEQPIRTGLSEKVNFELTLLKSVEQSRTRAIDSLIKDITILKDQYPEISGQKKNLDLETIFTTEISLPLSSEELESTEEPIIQVVNGVIYQNLSIEKENLSSLEQSKKNLPQSILDVLEIRFRAQFKGVRPFNSTEWLNI
jgi:DNA polymerase-3 subunit gamma/tau